MIESILTVDCRPATVLRKNNASDHGQVTEIYGRVPGIAAGSTKQAVNRIAAARVEPGRAAGREGDAVPRYDSPEHRAWWAKREEAYLQRPDVQQEIRAQEAAWQAELAAGEARETRLNGLAGRGAAGAQEALDEEMTRQSVFSGRPRLPSAREDEGEWAAFFREFTGLDMPLNAAYEAEWGRIERNAPPDIGGLQASYYEASSPRGYDLDELAAESTGITVAEFYADQAVDVALGTPGELWIRPAAGVLPAGPFTPAAALALLRAAPAAGTAPELLLWTPRTSRVLVGGTVSACDVTAEVNDVDRNVSTVSLAAGLPWREAAALAERASRLPQARCAEVASGGITVFTFVAGQSVGGAWPGDSPSRPALPCTPGDLTGLVRALLASPGAVTFPESPAALPPGNSRRRPRPAAGPLRPGRRGGRSR